MKVFSRRNTRIIYMIILLLLYFIYTKVTSIFFQLDMAKEFTFTLDDWIPFIPQVSFIYLGWVFMLLACFIYLYFSAGNSYDSYVFALALSLVIYNIVKIYLNISNIYPVYNSSPVYSFIYNTLHTKSFPSISATLLPTAMFYVVVQKIKHKRQRKTPLLWIFPLLLVIWIVVALLSKMVFLPELLIGLAISLVSSTVVCLIRCKSIY